MSDTYEEAGKEGAGRTVEQERDELANAVQAEQAKNGALTNALRFEQAQNQILLREVVEAEDELADGCLAGFEGVLSNETREFWREQLLTNRQAAKAALAEFARGATPVAGVGGAQGTAGGGAAAASLRKPLHNRALSRPVAPTVVGGGGAPGGGAEERAVKLRNRAQELRAAEGIPFSAAFRRAEKEMGQ